MAKAIEEQIPYLRSSNFLRTWSERQGLACEIEQVGLSTARSPPRVLHARVKDVPVRTEKEFASRKKKEPQDPWLNLLEAGFKVAETVNVVSEWMKSPAPPQPTPVVKAAPVLPKPVPPFDIQDVPKAMRKVGMPMAARLQERWFAGQENYSRSAPDLRNEIDQNGVHYAPAMVDSTTVKMEWILSFARAKRALGELIQAQVRKPEALKALQSVLAPYRNHQDVLGWNAAHSNFLEYHKKFQFQRQKVNATWGQQIAEFLRRSTMAGGVPDDLTGALGSFNLYAAVQYARFEPANSDRAAIVTHVSVYVRDPYEFSDDQYLGHWSPGHVAVVPAHQAASGKGWLKYPVVEGSVYDNDSVLYPVTNRDYRDWRQQHGQGGDFMIYTDRLSVRLDSPIRVLL